MEAQTKIIETEHGKEVFVGVWEDEQKGTGTITYEDGRVYTGAWEEGVPHGRGSMSYPQSYPQYRRYDGEYKHGEKSGQGTMHYYDGSAYKGGWEMGLRSGEGIMAYGQGHYETGVYKGMFLRDKRSGQGTLKWPSSDEHWYEYEGGWKFGEKNGQGTLKWGDGSVFTGGWRNGEKNGPGTLTYAQEYTFDGKQNGSYVGNWYAGTLWLKDEPTVPELMSQTLLTYALSVVATSKEPSYAAHMRFHVRTFVSYVGFQGHYSLQLDDAMGLQVWPILIQACRVAYDASRCPGRQWQLQQLLGPYVAIPERIQHFAGKTCYTMSTFVKKLLRKFQAAKESLRTFEAAQLGTRAQLRY